MPRSSRLAVRSAPRSPLAVTPPTLHTAALSTFPCACHAITQLGSWLLTASKLATLSTYSVGLMLFSGLSSCASLVTPARQERRARATVSKGFLAIRASYRGACARGVRAARWWTSKPSSTAASALCPSLPPQPVHQRAPDSTRQVPAPCWLPQRMSVSKRSPAGVSLCRAAARPPRPHTPRLAHISFWLTIPRRAFGGAQLAPLPRTHPRRRTSRATGCASWPWPPGGMKQACLRTRRQGS